MLYLLSGAAMLLGVSNADTYMHMPKGSNDRLNEQAAARNNENRLFNSQNNNRGGYNVGDLDPENGFTGADYIASATEMYDFRFLYEADTLLKQYEMLYFEGSQISVTWTNQHGAGSAKENTEMILQFICDTLPRASEANNQEGFGPSASLSGFSNGAVTAQMAAKMRQHGLRVELYNGGNTDTPDKPNALTANEITTNYANNMDNERGRRESEEYYALCNARSRNKGLFTADQQLQGTTQIYTRQNPGGTRYGLECQEERDHYPWWNPSPFHDVAIITADVQWCKDNVAPESQNVKAKYQCVTNGITPSTTLDSWLPSDTAVKANLDPEACAAAGHLWDGFSWNGEQPECVDSYYSRDNHLGNVDGTKRGGRMASYDWWVPMVDDLNSQHYCYKYTYSIEDKTESTVDAATQIECVRMMFRLRYNMSTMNFDPFNTDYRMNQDNNKGVISPIEQNPTVDVGAYAQGLRLAINTAQTGRTFQDNSHTFLVCKRPDSDWQEKTLFNINVRGKRGNIVQTFPAIEYDFEPQIAFIRPDECMHFQWEGSNTHNNGNPGGDGQTGDAGEGRGGSDRSNLLQVLGLDDSYPLTYDKISPSFFDYVTCYHPLFPGTTVSSQDCQLTLGSAGFYRSVTDALTQTNTDDKLLDYLLNNVSGAFRQGIIVCANGNALEDSNDVKEFSFISTRNNNFSNRSQKLKIVITADPEDEKYW